MDAQQPPDLKTQRGSPPQHRRHGKVGSRDSSLQRQPRYAAEVAIKPTWGGVVIELSSDSEAYGDDEGGTGDESEVDPIHAAFTCKARHSPLSVERVHTNPESGHPQATPGKEHGPPGNAVKSKWQTSLLQREKMSRSLLGSGAGATLSQRVAISTQSGLGNQSYASSFRTLSRPDPTDTSSCAQGEAVPLEPQDNTANSSWKQHEDFYSARTNDPSRSPFYPTKATRVHESRTMKAPLNSRAASAHSLPGASNSHETVHRPHTPRRRANRSSQSQPGEANQAPSSSRTDHSNSNPMNFEVIDLTQEDHKVSLDSTVVYLGDESSAHSDQEPSITHFSAHELNCLASVPTLPSDKDEPGTKPATPEVEQSLVTQSNERGSVNAIQKQGVQMTLEAVRNRVRALESEMADDAAYVATHNLARARVFTHQASSARKRFLQKKSPFAKLKPICLPSNTGSDDAPDTFVVESFDKTGKPTKSSVRAPKLRFECHDISVPKYNQYIQLRDNVLGENIKERPIEPFWEDSDDQKESEQRIKQFYNVREEDLTATQKCTAYAEYIDRILDDLELSREELSYYLLHPEDDIIQHPRSDVQRAITRRLSWFRDDGRFKDEAEEIEKLQKQGIAKNLPKPSNTRIGLAALLYTAFFEETSQSIFQVAKNYLLGDLQTSSELEVNELSSYRSLACRICHVHDCQSHGLFFEDLDSTDTEYDEEDGIPTDQECDDTESSLLNDSHLSSSEAIRRPQKKRPSLDKNDQLVSRPKDINHKKRIVSSNNKSVQKSDDDIKPELKSDDALRRFSKRHMLIPCNHEGSCEQAQCRCYRKKIYCEKTCGCAKSCSRRYPGCSCSKRAANGKKPSHHGKICGPTSSPTTSKCRCIQLNRECDPDLCGRCGVEEVLDPKNRNDDELQKNHCNNCGMLKGIPLKTYLFNSPYHGFGVVMGEPAKAHSFIMEYKGEILTNEEANRREEGLYSKDYTYMYTADLDRVMDGTLMGNKHRFVNHSEDPKTKNCYPRLKICNGEVRIGLYAERNIKVGEELLFNYGLPKEHLLNHGGKKPLAKQGLARKQGGKKATKKPKPQADVQDGNYTPPVHAMDNNRQMALGGRSNRARHRNRNGQAGTVMSDFTASIKVSSSASRAARARRRRETLLAEGHMTEPETQRKRGGAQSSNAEDSDPGDASASTKAEGGSKKYEGVSFAVGVGPRRPANKLKRLMARKSAPSSTKTAIGSRSYTATKPITGSGSKAGSQEHGTGSESSVPLRRYGQANRLRKANGHILDTDTDEEAENQLLSETATRPSDRPRSSLGTRSRPHIEVLHSPSGRTRYTRAAAPTNLELRHPLTGFPGLDGAADFDGGATGFGVGGRARVEGLSIKRRRDMVDVSQGSHEVPDSEDDREGGRAGSGNASRETKRAKVERP